MTTTELTKKLEDKYGLGGMSKKQVAAEFHVSINNPELNHIEHTRHGRGRSKGYRFCCGSVAKWWNESRTPGYKL